MGLYCDFLAQQGQSATNMVGAMLKQLATRGGITEYIREAFQKAKKEFGGRSLLLPDMVEILKKTIASLPRLFICIDALDECTPKHRRELLLNVDRSGLLTICIYSYARGLGSTTAKSCYTLPPRMPSHHHWLLTFASTLHI